MGEPSNAVFISYRREVGGMIAMALHQHLTQHGVDAFYDIESIRTGRFDTIILNQIAARPYFVLVLTPGSLERCDDPNDWLRREIEQALETRRVIVPVYTPNFDFDDITRFLPGDLGEEVRRFNAQELPQKWFKQAVEQLVEEFLVPTEIEAVAPSAEEQVIVDRLHEAARAVPDVTADQLTAQEYFEQAYARAAKDPKGAIADYSEAIRLNPEFAVAYYNRGLARRQTGDHEGASADEAEATRLESEAAKRAEGERERQEGAERQRDEQLKRARERRRLLLILGGVGLVILLSAIAAVAVLTRGGSDGRTTTEGAPTTTTTTTTTTPADTLFEDDFSTQEWGWRDVAQEQAGGSYLDGTYLIEAVKVNEREVYRVGVIVSPANAPTAEDVRIAVDVSAGGPAVDNDSGYGLGIVCRAADSFEDLYRFTYWPVRKQVHIQKRLNGEWTELPVTDEYLPVTDAPRKLEASCVTKGGAVELEFAVNGHRTKASDSNGTFKTGAYGLNALLGPHAPDGEKVEVEFDNFTVHEVEAERR
jgi:tetratricopeptide (TPR) repeat protein